MPMALLEAMGYGRACIATRVGGVPQVANDGRDGILVEPLDDKGIANAVISLLNRIDDARSLGLAAREKVQSRFCPQENLELLSRIYSVLGSLRKA